MTKYKIIPSSRTIVQSPISIGHKAEKGVEAIEFDLTAWVETYGSGTATIIMRRWGDAIPYPIALEIDENNKATWTLSDIDTAKAGMAYAQLNYIVGDDVVKKSDIYTFRVMDSLTGEGEPPEAYELWLEHLTHLAAEAMAEVLDIEGIATDKTLTIDGGIADAKSTGDALSALEDQFTEETGQLKADLDDLDERVTDIEAGGGGGSGGSSTLAGLTDTSISNKTDGQVLTYDATSHKWINETLAVAENSLIVTVSGTGVYRTCDKTYTEIYNAINTGKTVVAVDGTGVVYPYAGLMAQNGTTTIALGISVVYNKTATLTGYLIVDMNGSTTAIRQDQSNSFYDTSETYTRTEVNGYVTSRLNNYYTVNQINEKIGDIETLLAAI